MKKQMLFMLCTLLFSPSAYAGESVRIGPAAQYAILRKMSNAKMNKQVEMLRIGKFICENRASIVENKGELKLCLSHLDRKFVMIGFNIPSIGFKPAYLLTYLNSDEAKILVKSLFFFLHEDPTISRHGELRLKFMFGLLGPRGEDDGKPLEVLSIEKCLEGALGKKRFYLAFEDLMSIYQKSVSVQSSSNYLLIS